MFPCTSWVKTVGEVCVLVFSCFWWAVVNKFLHKTYVVLKCLLTVISVLKLIPIIILRCYAKLLISAPEVFYRGYRWPFYTAEETEAQDMK